MPHHRCWPRCLAAMMCGVPLVFGMPSAAQAEDDAAPSAKSRNGGFPELDSKYLFGNFTRGASVGDEGERAIEPDTVANFGKRSGHYAATLTELELEYSPTRFLQLELGPTISYYNIRGVPGLNDRNAGVVNGFSATVRSLLIEHGQWPFEVTLSVEPEWHNFDETNGDTVSNLCAGDEDRGRRRADQEPFVLRFQHSLRAGRNHHRCQSDWVGSEIDRWRVERACLSGDP